MGNLEHLLIENKPVECEKCKGRLYYIGNGRYYCKSCGHEMSDAIGKLKDFLSKNESTSVAFISQATGVSSDIVVPFLRQGGIDVPRDSKYYLECEKCGCSIREGKFCPFCVHELTGGIKTLLNDDLAARNALRNGDMTGRMHIRNRRIY